MHQIAIKLQASISKTSTVQPQPNREWVRQALALSKLPTATKKMHPNNAFHHLRITNHQQPNEKRIQSTQETDRQQCK